MKRFAIYATFWAASFCFEVLPWVPNWQPEYFLMTICNMGLYLALFVAIGLSARALAMSMPITGRTRQLYRHSHFWWLMAFPVIYTGLAWIDDKYILNSLATNDLFVYAVRRLKGALPYIIFPALYSGVVVYKDSIILAMKLRKQLQDQENALLKQSYRKLAIDVRKEVKDILNQVD